MWFRFVTPGKQRGPWRDTQRRAMLDAVRAGLGSVDEFEQPDGRGHRIYLHPFVRIERLAEDTEPGLAA
ncbi:hypothetical protein GVO57_07390 [Sphingomonas changnyeongensis]|uniref:Uncharacterized protein n=1 Tax=Sphingomonas changnyeongensis TaxID=2698679 RepID=A0A7Z2S530_9SPHN|nr:hypothetical protein [Sphingomonas changnyeongensis]QHL90690.1 hypothetical protein GVO57_07390 [Sphingomonas changnyeongensis]